MIMIKSTLTSFSPATAKRTLSSLVLSSAGKIGTPLPSRFSHRHHHHGNHHHHHNHHHQLRCCHYHQKGTHQIFKPGLNVNMRQISDKCHIGESMLSCNWIRNKYRIFLLQQHCQCLWAFNVSP